MPWVTVSHRLAATMQELREREANLDWIDAIASILQSPRTTRLLSFCFSVPHLGDQAPRKQSGSLGRKHG